MTQISATNPVTDPAADHEDAILFVIVLTYTSSLSAIDQAMAAHRRFLDTFFASGEFLASGPRERRIGGVILARASDRTRIDEIINADPFAQWGLASYEVIAFAPNRGPFASPLRTGR
jgi:uncharacterized protein YciI